jgi:DNA repair protein RadA/Sms
LREAYKHGFKQAIIPYANMPKENIGDMQIFAARSLTQAVDYFKNVSADNHSLSNVKKTPSLQ